MILARAKLTPESYVVTCAACDEPLPSPTGALNWMVEELEEAARVEAVATDRYGNSGPILGATKCACGAWSRITTRGK